MRLLKWEWEGAPHFRTRRKFSEIDRMAGTRDNVQNCGWMQISNTYYTDVQRYSTRRKATSFQCLSSHDSLPRAFSHDDKRSDCSSHSTLLARASRSLCCCGDDLPRAAQRHVCSVRDERHGLAVIDTPECHRRSCGPLGSLHRADRSAASPSCYARRCHCSP